MVLGQRAEAAFSYETSMKRHGVDYETAMKDVDLNRPTAAERQAV
jgi:hypothetical protein